jgi:hypothetical protein
VNPQSIEAYSVYLCVYLIPALFGGLDKDLFYIAVILNDKNNRCAPATAASSDTPWDGTPTTSFAINPI